MLVVNVPLDVSITTIASSTTRPVASVMPNGVSVLIEKPNNPANANVPIRGRQES